MSQLGPANVGLGARDSSRFVVGAIKKGSLVVRRLVKPPQELPGRHPSSGKRLLLGL